MSQARQYELVYIVAPDATDQDIADLHTQVETIVARLNGEMVRTENWGRRKLAYRIGKHREGTYVLEVFNGTGELTKELDRRLKVSDLVIRQLIVRVDEELGVAEHSRSRRQANAQKRAAKRPPRPEGELGRDGADRRHDDDDDEAED
ncbi:MAG: 30S ribosomal protein S6 [Vicinamibacterales bacterium]|nr:30S ribosomal protein S6 [Vicinamibacterales bacterium]